VPLIGAAAQPAGATLGPSKLVGCGLTIAKKADIAFVSPRASALEDICVVRPGGTSARQVTNSDADNEAPAWSPDGTTILYAKTYFLGGDSALHSISVDGSEGRAATPCLTWSALTPAWQPLR
jgi:Tol biopolymer transport system component